MAKYNNPHSIALAIVADRCERDPEKPAPIEALRFAADDIERLWQLVEQLAEALELQCESHRVPVKTRPYYTQHALDALAAFKEAQNG